MSQPSYARPFIYRDHVCWAECVPPGEGWRGVLAFNGKASWTCLHYPTPDEAVAAAKLEVDHRIASAATATADVLPKTWQNGLFDL